MDRSSIFATAKKHLLTYGNHAPLIFVETYDDFYRLPVENFDQWNQDTFSREKLLFLMGRKLAVQEAITPESVCSLYLVQEFWYIYRNVAGEEIIDPESAPDRKESLGMLEMLISQEKKQIEQHFFQCEIIRYGEVVDLAPYEEGENVQSYLLTCFLAGIATEQWSDKEFQKVVERYMEVGEI